MGEVYRARDTRLGRIVALKVLRLGADPELLHRLDREARAASALNHPNIVQIYDVGEAAGQEGAHYVVMEHVEGETLRRRLAQGPLLHLRAARPRRAAHGRPGQGAPRRHRPPRPEAREPDGDARGPAEDPRLRPGQGRGRTARRPGRARDVVAPRHAGRHAPGHPRVHVARAGEGRAARPPHRPVLGRPHPPRDGHGAADLPARHPGPGAGRRHRARPRAALPAAPGRSGSARGAGHALPPEGSRRAASRGPTSWPRSLRPSRAAPARGRWRWRR